VETNEKAANSIQEVVVIMNQKNRGKPDLGSSIPIVRLAAFVKSAILVSVTILIIMAIIVLSACRPAQRPFPQASPPATPPGQVQPSPNPANATGDAALGLNIPLVQASREQLLAYRISNDLINMPEVDRVNVLVRGPDAVIGFMPSDGYRNVSAIKDAIISRVNSLNLPITKILVSESADVMIRINQLNKDIINNRPISEVNAGIDQLINRIMPPVS
jgi:YhcN/YlaJ family sporulation lipoprotein